MSLFKGSEPAMPKKSWDSSNVEKVCVLIGVVFVAFLLFTTILIGLRMQGPNDQHKREINACKEIRSEKLMNQCIQGVTHKGN